MKMRLRSLIALVVAAPALLAAQAAAPAAPAAPAANNTLPLVPTRTLNLDTDEGTWISLDVSPNGQTIVFELLGDLYAMPAIGGAATRLIGGRPFESQPRFSPDGAQLVYISDRDGADNVWIANSNGTGPRQLSHERLATMFSPRWLSDGKAIVVSATDRDGVVELWRFDLDGGAPTKLGQRTRNTPSLLVSASYPGAYGAEPSPDGRLLYYTMVEPRQTNTVVRQTRHRKSVIGIADVHHHLRFRAFRVGNLVAVNRVINLPVINIF